MPRFFHIVLFWPNQYCGFAWLFDADPAHFDPGLDPTLHFDTDLDRDPAFFNAVPNPHQSDRICNIGLHTLLSSRASIHGSNVSLVWLQDIVCLYGSIVSLHTHSSRLLNLIWLLTLMWIRIRRLNLMRTRIRPLKMMPIHADPDPQHWVHLWPPASESWQQKEWASSITMFPLRKNHLKNFFYRNIRRLPFLPFMHINFLSFSNKSKHASEGYTRHTMSCQS